MSGHHHNSNAGTQNQGNSIGDRACVRQSKLYRTHESGNDVKCILGTSNLCWDTDRQEGAYKGQKVFDHMQPNAVSNEYRRPSNEDLRGRANDMKSNINSDYVNDWSTESGGSYKSRNGASSHRSNDENMNMMVRSNSGRYNNSDYELNGKPRMASQRASATSSMGGMSLSQFQSESSNYQQAPPQNRQARGSSGNSEGFASAMVQPDRDYNMRSTGRDGAPQEYVYKNNIYGSSDQAPQANRSGRAPPAYRQPNTAPYASDDYEPSYQQQSQYRAQYQEPAQGTYEYSANARGGSYGGSGGYAGEQQQQRGGGYGGGEYDIPGIAAEGAGNREGRSTRPW
eukprot:CAMPEP_0170374936 /NCGR_PEP_ID=MMETSP0117_2-20130122/10883_1 /TAXON_ID=400756 /ORGANISM="Durinskia baltica, Strain CSIRO CS-38" /LENGTH=340 /DNA_ID=CAMNT_0010629957 /DNA_START=59 /DNA_END=1081 /DNA_ORIENTATION=+